MAGDAVSASARGASFLILLQIISRAITFALNQILLRFLSPELLGVSVQLELYKIGTMYFSRESLRTAAERRSDGGVQASINLSYLAIIAGVPIGAAFAEWYLSMTYLHVSHFSQALRINQLAALVELVMEPAFTAVQQNLLYKARAVAEGLSVILKTLTVFGLFFWSNSQDIDVGVLPFATGELVNSITLMSVYWIWMLPLARKQNFSLLPKKMQSSPQNNYLFALFSKPLLWLIGSLWFQTGIKWLLTEGDKLLIGALASLEDQGMYALAANYGGLIARMIFQPIEVSSRNLFANLCATPSSELKEAADGVSKGKSEKEATKQSENLRTAAHTLQDILHAYSILSLFAFTIGPSLAPLLLRLIAGSRWTDSGAGEVLGIYCYYIPFLAINGVTEAFVAATASTTELHRQSFWMTGFSVLFAASAYFFLSVLEMGAQGLVLANCVNMALRIVFNLHYIKGYFGQQQAFSISAATTNIYAVAVAVGVASFMPYSGDIAFFQRYELFGDIVRIGGSGVILLLAVVVTEREFLRNCYDRFSS